MKSSYRCCKLHQNLPELSLRRAAESCPHSVFAYSRSTATAAPKLPMLLLAPANSTMTVNIQVHTCTVQQGLMSGKGELGAPLETHWSAPCLSWVRCSTAQLMLLLTKVRGGCIIR